MEQVLKDVEESNLLTVYYFTLTLCVVMSP